MSSAETFAGYQLEERVAEGDAGTIYKARDPRLQRAVALRVVAADLAADPLTRARLNRESVTLASVDHPNVLPVYDVGEHQGRIFIATRWVDSVTLAHLTRDEGPLESPRAVQLINQVAAALAATHALGIMHRNVKPTSVLVTGSDHAYLTEFGLARRASDLTGLTMHDHLLQTFDYLAPEYISDEQMDARMDIYGLGCVLYDTLTGEVPYPRSAPAAKVYAHLSTEPPSARESRDDVPERLDAVARRAMSKDPDERQQSASEFAVEAAEAIGLPTPPWAAKPRVSVRPHEDGARRRRRSRTRTFRVARGRDANADIAELQFSGASDSAASSVADEYSEPVFYGGAPGAGRPALWALAVLVFLAAPIALLVALIH